MRYVSIIAVAIVLLGSMAPALAQQPAVDVASAAAIPTAAVGDMDTRLAYMQEQFAPLPTWVRWWMEFQHGVFLFGFVFAFWHWGARWYALAIFTSHALSALEIYALPMEYLGLGLVSLNHWLWTPVLVYLVLKRKAINFRSPYGVWYALAIFQLTFSLVFDYRDGIRYIAGLLGN